MKRVKITIAVASILVGVAWLESLPANGQSAAEPSKLVNAKGEMHIPADYRRLYEYLGSWSISGEKGAKEMHIVYASPGTAAAYRASGTFPEGTVLIKEVQSAATSDMSTGLVSHPDHLVGWFMMVKDSKSSHPDNKLWGNGWGWSWFDAENPMKTTSTDFRSDCLGCHVPAKATDWIYVPGYQALRR